MLSETEIIDRVKYCHCVMLQLSWIYSNDCVEPGRYSEYLAKSSLDLMQDNFITSTLEEGAMEGDSRMALKALINLYEGITYGLCEVLQAELSDIVSEIPSEFLNRLAEEMEAGVRFDPAPRDN